MTRWWLALLFLPVAACDWFNSEDTGTDDTVDDSGDEPQPGCPLGMSESKTPGLTITTFTVDGLSLQAGFDAAATYDGRPSSCIADDGSAVDFLFAVDNDLYGKIYLRDITTDGSKDPNGEDEQLIISLIKAATPVTYLNGDWQSGTLYLSSVGDTIQFDFAGTGVRSGESLNIQFSAEASR